MSPVPLSAARSNTVHRADDREASARHHEVDVRGLATLRLQQRDGVRDADFVRSVGHETSLFFLARIRTVNACEQNPRAFTEVS